MPTARARSLQRYFPGGKTQLITEALKLAGAEVLDDTESGLSEAATLADAIDAIFAPGAKCSSRAASRWDVPSARLS